MTSRTGSHPAGAAPRMGVWGHPGGPHCPVPHSPQAPPGAEGDAVPAGAGARAPGSPGSPGTLGRLPARPNRDWGLGELHWCPQGWVLRGGGWRSALGLGCSSPGCYHAPQTPHLRGADATAQAEPGQEQQPPRPPVPAGAETPQPHRPQGWHWGVPHPGIAATAVRPTGTPARGSMEPAGGVGSPSGVPRVGAAEWVTPRPVHVPTRLQAWAGGDTRPQPPRPHGPAAGTGPRARCLPGQDQTCAAGPGLRVAPEAGSGPAVGRAG